MDDNVLDRSPHAPDPSLDYDQVSLADLSEIQLPAPAGSELTLQLQSPLLFLEPRVQGDPSRHQTVKG